MKATKNTVLVSDSIVTCKEANRHEQNILVQSYSSHREVFIQSVCLFARSKTMLGANFVTCKEANRHEQHLLVQSYSFAPIGVVHVCLPLCTLQYHHNLQISSVAMPNTLFKYKLVIFCQIRQIKDKLYLFITKPYEKGVYKNKTSWPAKVDPYYAK